jgi:hypothetical protein
MDTNLIRTLTQTRRHLAQQIGSSCCDRMGEPFSFSFMTDTDGSAKRGRLDASGSHGSLSQTNASSSTHTHTEGGIHIQTALLKITDALENLELRTRHLETATYITLSAPPDNPFLTGGLIATKEHKELVIKQRTEGKSPKERKELGGPALYVGMKWMIICGQTEARTHFTEKGLLQLTSIFARAQSPHDMDVVFSHSQTWMQRDAKGGFIRFKMTPSYHELEVQLTNWLLTMPNVRMEGQPAPRGPRMIALSETIDKSNINRYG